MKHEALIKRLKTTCLGLDAVDPLRLLVDDVVAALREPEQEPVATLEDLEQEIYQNTRNFVSRDVMEWMLKRYYTHPPQRTEQEPVAWMIWSKNNVPALTFTKPADKYVFDALYTHPPQRTWVWLTDEDIGDAYVAWDDADGASFADFARAIEAKLKQKNGYAEEKNT
jgi:hypothetical protein